MCIRDRCNWCLEIGYESDGAKQLLAKQKGGRYNINSGEWTCKGRHKFGRTRTSDVIRGKWCDYERCYTESISMAELKAIKEAAVNKISRDQQIEKIKSFDVDLSLGISQIEAALDKYPRTKVELVYLRLKYNTIEKIKNLAICRGGKCVTDEFVSVSRKLEWECDREHIAGQKYRWKEHLDSIANGSWCKLCKYVGKQIFKENSLRTNARALRISLGNAAVRRYFDNLEISYIPCLLYTSRCV